MDTDIHGLREFVEFVEFVESVEFIGLKGQSAVESRKTVMGNEWKTQD
jgi:hypothetical protein